MNNTRVVVFGYDELLLASLEFLTGTDASVAAAVFPSTRTDDRANAVRQQVAAMGIPILEQPPSGRDDAFRDGLASIAPDVILVWSYPMILSEEMLRLPRLGAVNIHLGLLPEYRGVNGIRWALLNGENQTGVTMHYMDSGIDTGDMIARAAFPIEPSDDIRTLMQKSRYAGLALLKNTWQHITAGTAVRMPQDHTNARYYSSAMAPPDSIDWHRPAAEIHNLVRASAPPFPGVRTFALCTEITVRRSALPTSCDPNGEPGTVEAVTETGFTVATGSGSLTITAVEIDGRAVDNLHLGKSGIVPGIRLSGKRDGSVT